MKKAILPIGFIAVCIFWNFNQKAFAQDAFQRNDQSWSSEQPLRNEPFGRNNQFGNQSSYGQYGYSTTQQFGIKNLIGDTVMNQQGDNLGNVADVIASLNGQISYIILSRGGILGFAGELTPVPWQAADVRVIGDQVTVNLSKERLDNAPSWQSASPPDFSDPRVRDQINSYFGGGQYSGSSQPSYGGQGAYQEYGPGSQGQGSFGQYRSHRIGEGSDSGTGNENYPDNQSGNQGGNY